MENKKNLATITILVKDRQANSQELQKLLTDNGHLILSRLGVNVERSCVENCTGLITIAVEGTEEEINDLTNKLNSFSGIVVKNNIMTE